LYTRIISRYVDEADNNIILFKIILNVLIYRYIMNLLIILEPSMYKHIVSSNYGYAYYSEIYQHTTILYLIPTLLNGDCNSIFVSSICYYIRYVDDIVVQRISDGAYIHHHRGSRVVRFSQNYLSWKVQTAKLGQLCC